MDNTRSQQYIIDELTVVCNSLGKLDENDGTYMRDRDCKPCLKEVQRFLGTDDKNHTARTLLGSLNIIKSDLIPLMVQYCDYNEGDPELFGIVLRLCTNLTSSVLLLFENQEKPTELDLLKIHDKLMTCLYGYKEAFASDEKFWSTLNVHLRHNDDDEVTFERLIILIRNILHIPVNATADMGIHADFDTHDMCLYRMEKSGMLATLIEIASETQKGTEYAFHIMEVVYLMLRDQNPITIASAKESRYRKRLDDTDVDKKRLADLAAQNRRIREAEKRITRTTRFVSSRLTGTYVAQNYKAIGGKALIVNKPIESLSAVNLDKGKMELRKARNKKPLSSETSMLISDKNTRSSKISYDLKLFCKKFIENVYNNYMQQIKHNLIQKKAQEHDESYYLWAIDFFSSFNRHLAMSLDNISETLSTSTLHFIQILINSYQDKLKIEKKKFNDISKRLHLALRAYREILNIIKTIDSESPFFQVAETIKKNIFNELEYSTMLVNLLQQYSEPKHSTHYLQDLIHTNHVFIELLEEYSKSHNPVNVEAEDDLVDDDNNKEAGDNNETEQEIAILEAQREKVKKKRRKRKAEFRTAHFMSRYCNPDIISAYVLVLREFRQNGTKLNLELLKFLERIVYDCQYKTMLEHASIFKCLVEIMDYDSSMPGYQGFMSLFKDLIRDFGSKFNKRRWMFQELLFWKTANECIEIEMAIDPPPPAPPMDLPPEDEEIDLDAPKDLDAPHLDEGGEPLTQLPQETIADLMAELGSSDDDDDDDEVVGSLPSLGLSSSDEGSPAPPITIDENVPEMSHLPPDDTQAQQQPEEPIDELMAELVSDEDSSQLQA